MNHFDFDCHVPKKEGTFVHFTLALNLVFYVGTSHDGSFSNNSEINRRNHMALAGEM